MVRLLRQGANSIWRVLTTEVLLACSYYHAVIGKLLYWQVFCDALHTASSLHTHQTIARPTTQPWGCVSPWPKQSSLLGFAFHLRNLFSYISSRLGEAADLKLLLMQCDPSSHLWSHRHRVPMPHSWGSAPNPRLLAGAAAGFSQRKWGQINHIQPEKRKKGCQGYLRYSCFFYPHPVT